jgi:DNA-binding MarR family transcriptional regulator
MSRDPVPPPGSPYAELAPAEVRAWYAYMKVHLRLRYEMHHQLSAEAGLSLADYDVLVALTSAAGGRMRVSALATRIGWERSRASHHVRRMAARDLVALSAAEGDRRATDVALTDHGWATLHEATPPHVALVRRVFLDALDDERLAAVAEAMELVFERLVEHGTLPRPEDHP